MSAVPKLGKFNKRRGLDEAPMLPSPPAPCVGCKHALRCKSLDLACDALAVFESVGASAARLAYAPRQPSAAIFDRIQNYTQRKRAPPPYRRPAVDDEGEAD